MAGNSFGQAFRITTFGESHGPGIGVVVDGCPGGLPIDKQFIDNELRRRRPGQSGLTTSRFETDEFEILSGCYKNLSTGAPITLWIENKDQRSKDYEALSEVYRPGHADFTYDKKWGHRDPRGGGRSSARETAARVAGGALAKLYLRTHGVDILGYTYSIGARRCPDGDYTYDQVEASATRCPHPPTAQAMEELILRTKAQGDSLGGTIRCVVSGVPVGLGEPVFDRLEADLAKAMLSINATKGFEIGSGFASAGTLGSANNDSFIMAGESIKTQTNHSGGVLGGISNGMPIWFTVAFKPTSTISSSQQTVNTAGQNVQLSASGRHDPCVVPRAVPIVEAMAALVLADHHLRNRLSRV